MKIEYVRFREPVRLLTSQGNREHLFLNLDMFDLNFEDSLYLVIREKGGDRITAIVPLHNCNYFRPSPKEETFDMEELSPEVEDLGDGLLIEIPRRGRPPKNAAYKSPTA